MNEKFKTYLKPDMFPSREKISEHLPAIFKHYMNLRVIIDCTEFFCQSPKNFEHQGNLYSHYKAHTTFNVLIGITPNGAICFVSDVFEGAISDPEIFIKSGLLELLLPGDLVVADRGFTVHDELQSIGATLNIPPFLNRRDHLTPQEEIETKKMAKQRIYVEHAVGRIKRFRIFKKVLPLSLRRILNEMVFVSACLANFQSPIVLDD